VKQLVIGLSLALLALVSAAGNAASRPLRVIAYETKPFFYRDAQGQPAGLENDILAFHAKTHGETLEVTFAKSFDDVLPQLLAGKADVAAATITVTAERQKEMDFSVPYFPVRVMLVVPRAQPVSKLAELGGATLATMHGTTYEKALQAGAPGAKLVYAFDEAALLDLVNAGKARAAAMDSAVAYGLLPRYPKLQLGIPLSAEQGLAFAVPKGSPLGAELSKTIGQLKASKIYFRLLEQHLGAEAAKMVAAGKG